MTDFLVSASLDFFELENERKWKKLWKRGQGF